MNDVRPPLRATPQSTHLATPSRRHSLPACIHGCKAPASGGGRKRVCAASHGPMSQRPMPIGRSFRGFRAGFEGHGGSQTAVIMPQSSGRTRQPENISRGGVASGKLRAKLKDRLLGAASEANTLCSVGFWHPDFESITGSSPCHMLYSRSRCKSEIYARFPDARLNRRFNDSPCKCIVEKSGPREGRKITKDRTPIADPKAKGQAAVFWKQSKLQPHFASQLALGGTDTKSETYGNCCVKDVLSLRKM